MTKGMQRTRGVQGRGHRAQGQVGGGAGTCWCLAWLRACTGSLRGLKEDGDRTFLSVKNRTLGRAREHPRQCMEVMKTGGREVIKIQKNKYRQMDTDTGPLRNRARGLLLDL